MASLPEAASTPQPKKTRKNPARRKSEQAKAQKEPTVEAVPLPTNAKQVTTKVRLQRSKSEGNTCTSLRPQTQTRPPLPKTVSQQDSGQLVNSRQNQSTSPAPPSSSRSKALALAAPALVTGGLLGCAAGAAILLGVSVWYDYTGVEAAILSAKAAKLCLDNLADEVIASLHAGTYSGDEALDMLRRTSLAYASTIPGGTNYVEKVFREIHLVRKFRGKEFDRALAETHAELSRAGRRGAQAPEMRLLVIRQLSRLSGFAGNSLRDVVDRNPTLKPVRDGAIDSLKGSPKPKEPTIKLNVSIRSKQPESA